MAKNRTASPAPSSQETIGGFTYLAFQFFFLPPVLSWFNGRLSHPLSSGELNFLFYFINFMAVLLIFHDFLGQSLRQVGQHPAYFCQAVVLGFVAYYACRYCTSWIIAQLSPGFQNYNDQAIAAMGRGSYFLTLVGTVVLVPPVEECFYRGLVFRTLYPKSRWAAYILSMVVFSIIHILGYIGVYQPLELTLAVLQYLPAGLCLAWAYIKGGTIFAPIAIHAAINFFSIHTLR